MNRIIFKQKNNTEQQKTDKVNEMAIMSAAFTTRVGTLN